MTDTTTVNNRIINIFWKGLMGLMRMEKYSSRALLLLTVGLILAGCSRINDGKEHRRHVIAELMDSAEVIMNDDPETALRFMDSIDSHSISGRERIARYALLYSEAQYKNGIDAADDSLIMIAVQYYSINKNLLNRFRSYYMLGCTYNGLGQLTNAAVALGQAELLVGKINDGYRLGLLYTQLGNTFFDSYDFRRAEHYYSMAMYNYKDAGKESHRIYALQDIGGCKIQLKEYYAAHDIMDEVYSWAVLNNDSLLAQSSQFNKLVCSINTGDTPEAMREHAVYIGYENPSGYDLFTSLLMVRYYILTGQEALADSFLTCSKKMPFTEQDSIKLWYNLSLISELKAQPDSALLCYRKSVELQNRYITRLLEQPAIGAQKDYFQTESETESMIANRRKSSLIIVSLLLITTIAVSIVAYLLFRYRTGQKINDYLNAIEELVANDTTNKERLSALHRELSERKRIEEEIIRNNQLLNSRVKALINEQFGPTDYVLTRYYDFSANREDANQLVRIFKDQLKDLMSENNGAKIDSILNELYSGIMERLSSDSFKLSRKELNVFRFLLSGLSVKSVGTMMECSKDSIYKTRDRALEKIRTADINLHREICNALKNK